MIHKIIRRPTVDDSHLPAHLPPLLRQLYARRGVMSAECELVLKGLLRPDTMKGLDHAAKLIADAMQLDKSILIVGDFDADGATSTSVCILALRMMGASKVDYLIPNRFDYGYGLSPEIVAVAATKQAELLITVDNGISSIEGVAAAKAFGMQVVITDHHLPGHELPAADAIVNPNQPGCQFASKSIAGVGVAFYLMTALRAELRTRHWYQARGIAEPNLGTLLDIVALGTVADVVSLDANNRILVEAGLQRVRSGRCRVGITALLEVAKRNPARIVASDFGFADALGGNNALKSITITALPAAGTLQLNQVDVSANQVIPVAALSGLQFEPASNANATTAIKPFIRVPRRPAHAVRHELRVRPVKDNHVPWPGFASRICPGRPAPSACSARGWFRPASRPDNSPSATRSAPAWLRPSGYSRRPPAYRSATTALTT